MASESKHVILGTAGHVDHGKTTLIRAMTGINTDRLKEEQERGLTIDIGFAHIRLPSGHTAGIVDVPGHERFLKNMLAGVSGVDIAMLVVAADEGVMPQTTEHIEILQILETRQGVVALTKCDMVESDWIEVVEDDVRRALKETFLSEARIVRVSGTTGEGLEELVREIDRLAELAQQRSSEGPFRLPVDRAFTMTGFGTVVTGTLVSGTLRVGDPVTLLPKGLQSRVRGLQVHGKKHEQVVAGSRTAVNLVGLEVAELQRGDVLVPPGYLQATTVLDASVRTLPRTERALTNRARVRVHIGTAEAIGRATILGADSISPGSTGMVQLRLESAVAAARGDRFVVRFYSPTCLLGGGVVLDPTPAKHRRADVSVVERLQRALEGNPDEIVHDALLASETGLIRPEIARRTGLTEQETTETLKRLAENERIVEHAGRILSRGSFDGLAARAEAALAAYHNSNPMRSGMPKEELRAHFGSRMDPKGFQAILGLMSAQGTVVTYEATVKLSAHVPTLDRRQQEVMDMIAREYADAGVNPPLISETEQRHGPQSREMVSLLVERGDLVKVTPELFFHADALAKAEHSLRGYLQTHGQMTVAQFRDLVGSSRKYAVPLLELFDSKRITRRSGDVRTLIK